jgi:hypothetical protein
VAERKPFLLRLPPEVLDALQRWAADDLRSLNGQIEFLLRRDLGGAGRAPRTAGPAPGPPLRTPATREEPGAPPAGAPDTPPRRKRTD